MVRAGVKMENNKKGDPILRANIKELLELRAEQLSDYLGIPPEMAATYIAVHIMLENSELNNDVR